MMVSTPIRIGLYGCPPGTGNLGVDALRLSTIEGLKRVSPNIDITVFDYGFGEREAYSETGFPIRLYGASFSRRLYSPANLQQALIASRLRLGSLHPTLRYIRKLDILCDITGGDSFTDLYGPRRFLGSTIFKDLAIATRSRLILLPQTYGPFRLQASIAKAKHIFTHATQVWARDADSLALVQNLNNISDNSPRYRQTVDVAFGLPAYRPSDDRIVDEVAALRERATSLVCFNVSGLLFNEQEYARKQFGFGINYNNLIRRLLDHFLADANIQIILVPHVRSTYKHDCDSRAIQELVNSLPKSKSARVLSVPNDLSPMEVKWLIGQSDWLCATRMHAAIAGVSQDIPTAAIAYSDKTLGVFATVGARASVFDPRSDCEDTLFEKIAQHYSDRKEHAAALQSNRDVRSGALDDFFRTLLQGMDR